MISIRTELTDKVIFETHQQALEEAEECLIRLGDPKYGSFFIIEMTDGSYIQLAGKVDQMIVEKRTVDQTHFRAALKEPHSDQSVELEIGGVKTQMEPEYIMNSDEAGSVLREFLSEHVSGWEKSMYEWKEVDVTVD